MFTDSFFLIIIVILVLIICIVGSVKLIIILNDPEFFVIVHQNCLCCDEIITDHNKGMTCKDSLLNPNEKQHIYCNVCSNKYLNTLIENNDCVIKCINHPLGCKYQFNPNDISIYLENENIQKLNDLIIIKDIQEKTNNIPNYQSCPECKKFGCVVTNDIQYYTCDLCKYCWCKDCKEQFHSTNQCGVFDFTDVDKITNFDETKIRNMITELINNGLSHVCPKCNVKYEKIDGCNHITCSICKTESCYSCGLSYIDKGVRACQCNFNINDKQIKHMKEKKVYENLKNIVILNKNEKIKSIIIDEIEKRGYNMPYRITGDKFKSFKRWLVNLFN